MIVAKKLLYWLDEHAEETVMIVLLLMITLLSGAQVFMRKILHSPLTWSEELSRFCFIWSGFLGVGYCIRKGLSIRIDTLISLIPQYIQKLLNIFTGIISLVLYAAFVKAYIVVIIETAASKQTSPALGIPFEYIYFGAFLGILIAVIRLVQMLVLNIGDIVKFKQVDAAQKGVE